MSPTLLSTLALLFFSYTHDVNASWSMQGRTMLTARMDPLVSPNAVASHVHNVIGGNNFATTYDYDNLRQSSCSTIEVQEDKSNYWAPSLYYKHQDTGKYELVPSRWAVYYLHRGDEPHVQFPKGLRMIAGSPSKTQRNSTDDDAFNYHCLGGGDDTETLELPKHQCDAIRIQVMFPSCWNGVDATSANFKDHVSYPVGSHEFGTCPTTHPKRLITIFIEQIAETKNFPYYDGAFSLSTGDTVGYSSHADFQNGWDASENSILKQAIDQCLSPSAGLDGCPVLKKLTSNIANVCSTTSKLPVEDVGIYGGLDKIPGDNAPWGGSVPKKPTGVSNKPPFGSAISILPNGWEYHGCIDEGNPGSKTLVGDTFTDPLMNAALCVDHCDQKGYVLAGLQDGKECNCAKELTNGGSMNLVDPWNCGSPCPGNQYEFCGQSRKINLYQKTGIANGNNNSTYPPVGSKFTQVFTDNGTTPQSVAVQNPPTNTTSTNAPQTSNPPSTSASGMNGPMDRNSTAPPTTTPPNAPQTSNPPSTSASSSNGPMDQNSAAPRATTPTNGPKTSNPPSTSASGSNGPMDQNSGAPPATTQSNAPKTSNPPSTSGSGSNGPMDQNSAAPPATTPPNAPKTSNPPSTSTSGSNGPMDQNSAAPPTTTPTPPVCHTPKMVKRVPSFLKREPMEEFHVPAKHRRMHH